jgi:hypothetical protein
MLGRDAPIAAGNRAQSLRQAVKCAIGLGGCGNWLASQNHKSASGSRCSGSGARPALSCLKLSRILSEAHTGFQPGQEESNESRHRHTYHTNGASAAPPRISRCRQATGSTALSSVTWTSGPIFRDWLANVPRSRYMGLRTWILGPWTRILVRPVSFA